MSTGALAAASAAKAVAPTGQIGENAKAWTYVLIVIFVLVVMGITINKVFGGMDAILIKLGLKKSPEDKARDLAIDNIISDSSNPESPFNPIMFKSSPTGTKLITTAFAQSLAKQIWDSVGFFSDDSDQGVAAFKQLGSWAQCSFLSDQFAKKYNTDLIKWLINKYDTESQKNSLIMITNYVKKLPKY